MRPSNNYNTGLDQCNVTVINLGPSTASEDTIFLMGDIFFQLFYAQFASTLNFLGDSGSYPVVLVAE